jgi:hypothetical protein
LFETRHVFLQCKALGPEIREGRKTRKTIDTGEFKMPRKYVGMQRFCQQQKDRQEGRAAGRDREMHCTFL